MSQPNFDRALLSLHVFLRAVFNERKLLKVNDWKVFVGIADYLKPQVPNEFKDKERAIRLGVTSRYGIGILPEPINVTDDGTGWFNFGMPISLHAPKARWLVKPAFFFKRRADLVVDDVDELARCGFYYTGVATRLTPAYRQKIYGKYLSDVLPPQDDQGGFFDSGATFAALVKERATYSNLDTRNVYYPKWLIENPAPKSRAKDREFGFDQLTDTYILENFQSFELQKDAVYVYLRIAGDAVSVLIQLHFDVNKQQQLTWKVFNAQGLPEFGDFFQIASDKATKLNAQKVSLAPEAWFFYSVDGTSEFLRFLANDKASPTGSSADAYFEQAVDPQWVVQSARNLPFDQIEKDMKRWTSRDWLKEMVRLRFSEPWVWFWNNTGLQMFYDIDREALFLKELRDAEKVAVGPLKQKLRDFRMEAERDTKVLLIRRGSNYGASRRVIGSDSSYVYFYNNHQNLVTRQPMGVFWKNLNISMISTVIYENTRGIVPIGKVVVWGGVFVIGWGIFGTSGLLNGLRQSVADRVSGVLADAALREGFVEIRNRILLCVLNPILALFPIGNAKSTEALAFGFFRGFILGYTHDALLAMYQRWDAFAALEPASYKAIKLMMKIEGVLRIVDDKISLIKDKVSERIGNLLLDRFVASFVDAFQGTIGIVNNLYFLDYERVEEFLKAYEELTGEKAPSKLEWDKLRHKHLLVTFREYHAAIEEAGADLKDIYTDVKKGTIVLQRAVRIAETYVLVEVVSGGVLMAMVMHALTKGAKVAWKVGKVASGAAIIGAVVSSKFREELIEALRDFMQVTAVGSSRVLRFTLGSSMTPDRMEKLGQLIGQVWGGMTLNKAVFGKKTWMQNWDASASYKSFVTRNFLKSQLSVSPVLPIIKLALFNYVYLIEKVIKDSKEAWKEFEVELDVILRGDPEFRDIIEADHQLTLAKILKIIGAVDVRLTQWLTKLASDPELALQIKSIADLIDRTSPEQLPTFKMLRDGTMSPDGWVREALMFVILSHLQVSLRLLAKSIEDMYQPVDENDRTSIDLMYLLQVLGFQQNEKEIEEILDRNFDDAFKEKI